MESQIFGFSLFYIVNRLDPKKNEAAKVLITCLSNEKQIGEYFYILINAMLG